MRAFWRLLRLFFVVGGHTLYTSLAVRRRPAAERAAFRAWRQHVGCRALCRALGVRVTVEGAWPEGRGMLLVCNHFGVLDPLVLSSEIPLAAVSKAEVAQWPLLGWVCRTMGVIFVERERRTQTGSFVETVQDRLHRGVPVLVFPEGTTSGERRVQPFKTGAFEAVADMPDGLVLPLHLDAVTVEGRPADAAVRARVVWADSSLSFTQHVWQLFSLRDVEMRVRVGTPLSTDGRSRKELAQISQAHVTALSGRHAAL
jgi:1-acyl-sn-glycerol-3-phosphate acyltransferase